MQVLLAMFMVLEAAHRPASAAVLLESCETAELPDMRPLQLAALKCYARSGAGGSSSCCSLSGCRHLCFLCLCLHQDVQMHLISCSATMRAQPTQTAAAVQDGWQTRSWPSIRS